MEKRESLWEHIVLNANVAVAQTDKTHRVEFINPAFTRLFGFTSEESVGKLIYELISNEAFLNHHLETRKLLEKGQSRYYESMRQRKDGALVHISGSVFPIIVKGKITGHVGFYVDITGRKEAEAALQRANDELESRIAERTKELLRANSELEAEIQMRKKTEKELKEAMGAADLANQSKSLFLANMSHEIRTPMNAIMGMSNLILDTALDEQQREYIEVVRKSSDALLEIINDILDFSKIEAGKMELEEIDFDLRVELEDIVNMLSPETRKRGIKLTYEIDHDIPSLLIGDPGRLRQILVNLAGNAIKFTHEGEIIISITSQKEDDKQVDLQFAIQDTGIGISPTDIKRLFQAFHQVDASTTRQYGGTGLGLAISKELSQMMGGTIDVESKEGEGSTFWFTGVFKKQMDIQEKRLVLSPDFYEKRFLAVDDNRTNLKILQGYMEAWGLSCDIAWDGEMALAMMEALFKTGKPYDLLVSDMQMAEMDGMELGQKVKSHEDLKHTAMILLSSRGMRGDAAKIKAVGFDAYLTKPLQRSQLFDCMVMVLGEGSSEAPSQKQFITRHTIAEARKRKVRILLVEDNPINQRVALNILEKYGYRVDGASDGQEAINTLEKTPYDLVLMDVQMPVMDGLKATEMIRDAASNVLDRNIPIIAMTAHAMKGDRERCLHAGMNDYVSKPVDPELLFEAIQKQVADKDP